MSTAGTRGALARGRTERRGVWLPRRGALVEPFALSRASTKKGESTRRVMFLSRMGHPLACSTGRP